MKLVIFEVLDWKLEVHINLAVFSDSNNIGKLDDQPEKKNNFRSNFLLLNLFLKTNKNAVRCSTKS